MAEALERPAKAQASDAFGVIAPLSNLTTVEKEVARELRRLIVTGTLPAGMRLTQRALAARLDVSQTPVRSALLELEAEGLVSSAPRGGSRVTELSFEDMEEIYAARSGLEGLAARRGAEAMRNGDVERMREVFETITGLGEAQAIDAYITTRWEFHAICYRAARRERLLREVERLFLRAERYNRLVLSTPERFRESVERHHRNLLEACASRDGAAAEEAIRVGMKWCIECLTPALMAKEPA